ncbi:MAG: AarF/UbiB family protein [Chthoniobacterales bacterium]
MKEDVHVKGVSRHRERQPRDKTVSAAKAPANTGLALSRFHAIATAERGTEIVAGLLRFGFGEFVRQSGLGGHEGKALKGSSADKSISGSTPVRVRLLLQSLGPTFIKIGQIMSTRPDLIPPEWVDELKKLQCDVPAAPWEGKMGVARVLKKELGSRQKTEFRRIDETAMAAASMAQVHCAELIGGERVVLKILRPGIREQMAADMELLRQFAKLIQPHVKNLGVDALEVVSEFSKELAHETDLTIEAESTRRMYANFEDNPHITFPRVYDDVSTQSILVLEHVEAELLAKMDLTQLSRNQREQIVRNGADMVFRQCLEIGFFHADPHPGNIFVLKGQKLCFIDCGMTGLIDPTTMELLATIVHGTVNKELDNVVRVAIELSNGDTRMVGDRIFRSDVWRFIDRFSGTSLESMRLGLILNEFFKLLRKHHLKCPADIVYLIKAVTTIEGVAEEVAPEFDFVSYVRPFLEKAIGRRYSIEALIRRAKNTLLSFVELAETLPADVGDLIREAKDGRIRFQLTHLGLSQLTNEVERASMNISSALVIASLILGSAILILADNLDRTPSALTTIAIIGFIVAVVAGLLRLLVSKRVKPP